MGIVQRILGTTGAVALAGLLTLSPVGVQEIKTHEGTSNTTYLDSANIPTICSGHTATASKVKYRTDAECDTLLKQDTTWASNAVRESIKGRIHQRHFDALVSFCFSVGRSACINSKLFSLVNEQKFDLASEQFLRWKYITVKGKKLDCNLPKSNCKGLIVRREDETRIFNEGTQGLKDYLQGSVSSPEPSEALPGTSALPKAVETPTEAPKRSHDWAGLPLVMLFFVMAFLGFYVMYELGRYVGSAFMDWLDKPAASEFSKQISKSD